MLVLPFMTTLILTQLENDIYNLSLPSSSCVAVFTISFEHGK